MQKFSAPKSDLLMMEVLFLSLFLASCASPLPSRDLPSRKDEKSLSPQRRNLLSKSPWERVRRLWREGKLERGVQVWEEVSRRHPRSSQRDKLAREGEKLLLDKIEDEILKDRFEAALKWLQYLKRLQPSRRKVEALRERIFRQKENKTLQKVRDLAQKKDFEKALDLLFRTLLSRPQSFEAHLLLGRISSRASHHYRKESRLYRQRAQKAPNPWQKGSYLRRSLEKAKVALHLNPHPEYLAAIEEAKKILQEFYLERGKDLLAQKQAALAYGYFYLVEKLSFRKVPSLASLQKKAQKLLHYRLTRYFQIKIAKKGKSSFDFFREFSLFLHSYPCVVVREGTEKILSHLSEEYNRETPFRSPFYFSFQLGKMKKKKRGWREVKKSQYSDGVQKVRNDRYFELKGEIVHLEKSIPRRKKAIARLTREIKKLGGTLITRVGGEDDNINSEKPYTKRYIILRRRRPGHRRRRTPQQRRNYRKMHRKRVERERLKDKLSQERKELKKLKAEFRFVPSFFKKTILKDYSFEVKKVKVRFEMEASIFLSRGDRVLKKEKIAVETRWEGEGIKGAHPRDYHGYSNMDLTRLSPEKIGKSLEREIFKKTRAILSKELEEEARKDLEKSRVLSRLGKKARALDKYLMYLLLTDKEGPWKWLQNFFSTQL